jgi:snurportin-1
MQSNYRELHKPAMNFADRQSQRRQQLLAEQKLKRQSVADSARPTGNNNIIESSYISELLDLHTEFVKAIHSNKERSKYTGGKQFRKTIQQSEWLVERPENLAEWTIIPCPVGKRCIIVATDRTTIAYTVNGSHVVKPFKSNLPGGGHHYRNDCKMSTILDCVYVSHLRYFYVLDLIHYGEQSFENCEQAFRMYFLLSRLQEENFELPGYQLGAPVQIAPDRLHAFATANPDQLFYNCPTMKLDGLLFYHQQSTYVRGKTPLVGWLYAFMLPEMLPDLVGYVHESHLEKKPAEYTNYLQYIEDYEAAEASKPGKKGKKKGQGDAMDQEPIVGLVVAGSQPDHQDMMDMSSYGHQY